MSASYHTGASSGGAGTGIQASPLPVQRLQMEEGNGGGGTGQMSPVSSRSMMRRESHVLADISENEALSAEQSVANIAAMFPTVDETHIKELLRK